MCDYVVRYYYSTGYYVSLDDDPGSHDDDDGTPTSAPSTPAPSQLSYSYDEAPQDDQYYVTATRSAARRADEKA